MFTIDELSIIKIYTDLIQKQDRNKIIALLNESLPFVEEPEMKEIVKSTITKSHSMTQEAFANLDLSNTLAITDS